MKTDTDWLVEKKKNKKFHEQILNKFNVREADDEEKEDEEEDEKQLEDLIVDWNFHIHFTSFSIICLNKHM